MLLTTHILQQLRTAQPQALVCSAGSAGYNALNEMLQSRRSGNTLLIESGCDGEFATADDSNVTTVVDHISTQNYFHFQRQGGY